MVELNVQDARTLYEVVSKWYALIPMAICPVNLMVDAPFGRFAPTDNFLTVDGIKAWIVMELVSPAFFTYAFLKSPLSPTHVSPPLSLSSAPTLLGSLFLTHYANRAIISPLRTPSRSRSHIMVPMMAIAFNVVNGSLMGTYLSSPKAQHFLASAFARPSFWFGVALWAVGFIGNVVHDEILLNIRRKPSKEKGQENTKNHYSIPRGLLYKYISYPNYFCEWMEWIGFAIAAAPLPSIWKITSAPPPWLFVFSEILLMLPRAYKGHKWYQQKFPQYPKERKVVIPFIF